MSASFILLLLAVVVFLLGVIDKPPASSTRMIALGLFLLTLAQLTR